MSEQDDDVLTRGRPSNAQPSKTSRWGGSVEDNKVANLLNMPTAITGALTAEQVEAYALSYRIEEITEKLKLGEVVPAKDERSPSPAPQYDSAGKRVNTTESRYRQKLENERHVLVEKALRTIPNYKPPPDYKRPQRTQEKIYIPVNDYPEINFIGLLIGPRGNTLKQMEKESLARIAIRGKGSMKEGKGRSENPRNQNAEEDLHCLITADTDEKIQKAIELVNKVIETAASIPEGQNELKRGQLRELAALNGTLRDDENQACQNCGEIGHRKLDCPQRKNYTSTIKCYECGNFGHMARDCKSRGRSDRRQDYHEADRDYDRLMAELGGKPDFNEQGGFDSNGQQHEAPWQNHHATQQQHRRSNPWNDDQNLSADLPPPPRPPPESQPVNFNPAPGSRPNSEMPNNGSIGGPVSSQSVGPPGVSMAPPGLSAPPGLPLAPPGRNGIPPPAAPPPAPASSSANSNSARNSN